MKKTLLTVALVTASLAAFAQGKVSLAQDGGSLVTMADAAHLKAQDAAFAGQAAPTNLSASLEVGLYGGTASGSLTLQTSELLYPNGGLPNGWWATAHCITVMPGWVPGQVAYFQVVVWDSAYTTPTAANAAASYYGADNIFAMTPGSSITYPNIYNAGNSTWAAVGDESPLVVGIVPEPTTLALAGLGAAALVIFRRRK